MISINNVLKDKDFINKISLVIFFSISWFSISTTFQNLLIFHSNESVTINQLINFARSALNICIFPILLFLLVKMLIKKSNLNSKTNLILLFSLIYFFSQTPALFYTSNSIENLIYVLSAINLIMIMRLSVEIFKPNELIILVYISFVILFFIFINSFFLDIYNFIYDPGTVRFYGNVNIITGESVIRSSGVSRIALIIMVIYSTVLKKYINSESLKILPLLVLSTIIFLYESRAVIGLLFVFVVVTLCLKEKLSYKDVIKYLFFCLVIPWLASVNLNYIQSNTAKEKNEVNRLYEIELKNLREKVGAEISSEMKQKLRIEVIEKLVFEKQYSEERKLIISEKTGILCSVTRCDNSAGRLSNKNKLITSSGRFDDWKNLINLYDYKNNLFFGYGAQGDRHLINQTASNALIYSLASSGVIGLSFFLFFSFMASWYVIQFILNIKFISKSKNIEPLYYFSIFTLMIILIRSLIESSYAVFGVDFILFFMSLFLAQKYNRSIK